ncbi:hypothetical protein Tco_1131698 [Tanacetum coccineum]|uniref:Transposase (Putative), gypsy type n=1 Tax=Tanacetum coccineum TaxID=301880 RepID=A0ABQ5JCN1_9ASTR
MEDPATATESSGTPSTIEKSPLDFDNENQSQQVIEGDGAENPAQETVASETLPPVNSLTTRVAPNRDSEEEVAADVPLVSKRRRKRGNDGANANAPPKVLRKDFDASHPTQSIVGGKSLALMGLEAGSILVAPASQETPAGTIDPDPLSYANPQSVPERDVAQSSKGDAVTGDPESEHTSFTSISMPGLGGAPSTARILLRAAHLPNDDFLCQYNMNLARQMAMGSQLRLRYKQEVKLLKKSVAQVARRDQRIQATEREIRNLQALLEAEADMKKAAEANNMELSKELESLRAKFSDLQYEDDRVSSRCAEMNARLDALSIDFDEELYTHMLTAITGRRWVIGHGLRLAVLKCAESLELRQAFANVVSAGIAKGFCDGLKYGVEQGEVELDLENIEAYDPKAKDKFMATMQVLKDLKYPLIDELEKLKDTPMDIAVKEKMPLEDAIAANKSRAEKERKCRIICRTHGVGFAHHARSDGVPVFAPTVIPQGLQIPLKDAAAQTEPPEDR